MPRMPVVKSKELVRVLNRLGFIISNQVGSHAQFKHPDGRRVTISIHTGQEVKRKTFRGIIADLGITMEEFVVLLRGK